MEGGLRANQGASQPGVDASGQPTRLPCGSNLAGPGECVRVVVQGGRAGTDRWLLHGLHGGVVHAGLRCADEKGTEWVDMASTSRARNRMARPR